MELNNKCEPGTWLFTKDIDIPVWPWLECRAMNEDYKKSFPAAALLALRSTLETHRVAGMDIYNQLDELGKRLDCLQMRVIHLEETLDDMQ